MKRNQNIKNLQLFSQNLVGFYTNRPGAKPAQCTEVSVRVWWEGVGRKCKKVSILREMFQAVFTSDLQSKPPHLIQKEVKERKSVMVNQ